MVGQSNGYAAHKKPMPQKDLGGVNWIPWESSLVQSMPDPTRIFSFLVIGIMLLRYLESHEWQVPLILSGFILNPWVVGFFLVATATVVLSLPKTQAAVAPLQVYDRWAAEWYWWNAWLYHAVMDGASGTFQLVPVVVQQYSILDLRFVSHHTVPWTIGAIEMFIMQPLCLATIYAILTRSSLRFPLEIVTSTFHMVGAIIFVAAEVYDGQLNVPALDPVGVPGDRWANTKVLDFYHFTYYWFGFWFCNGVWVYVPFYRILRAVQECSRSLAMTSSTPVKAD